MTAADMQGAKTTYGMRECSHSVWCKCQSREGGPQHSYPTEPVQSYDEMLKYIKEVGCTMKTFEDLCSWAHYSPGVARGGRFTAFECSCCGYKPSEKQWRSDLAKWHGMTDAERNEARKVAAALDAATHPRPCPLPHLRPLLLSLDGGHGRAVWPCARSLDTCLLGELASGIAFEHLH